MEERKLELQEKKIISRKRGMGSYVQDAIQLNYLLEIYLIIYLIQLRLIDTLRVPMSYNFFCIFVQFKQDHICLILE